MNVQSLGVSQEAALAAVAAWDLTQVELSVLRAHDGR